jgi:hypothetical protein
MLAFFLTHFWQFFFAPPAGPWYTGNVYGNVVAVVPCGVLAWLWARSSKAATHALLRQHHAEAMEQREAHELAAEKRHVALLESHKAITDSHVELHRKLDALTNPPKQEETQCPRSTV